MSHDDLKRKLTAILSADVEGYSRLMREDEEATICRLTDYRKAMTSLIQQYRGRVVDAPGDNLLAEFGSVVDAVNCAVEIQRELAERNAELPDQCRMQFRIGVNLGDVIEEGERIYGDGVNIAARMESLAEAGGICISGTVYDSIVIKLGLEYEYLGEQAVKNIPELIRSYRVLSYPGAAAHRVVKAKKAARKKLKIAVMSCVAVLIVAVGFGGILYLSRNASRPSIETAAEEKMAVPLSDKPSIAVLPFDNISGDSAQEHFSDGITDDLITDLSKISDLFVVARNSVIKYKGRAVDVNNVGRELGVRYVLEGSVRMAGNNVRVNAQLIDTITVGHLWAERYEGQTDNIFSLQEKIVQNVAEAISVKLTIGEMGVIPKKETNNLEAYLIFLKGWQHFRRFNPDAFLMAIPLFEKAIELDPNYWRAYAVIAKIYLEVYQRQPWRRKLRLSRTSNYRLVDKYLTIAMKNPTPIALEVATQMHIRHADYERAVTEANRAVSLDPNDPDSHFAMGQAMLFAGKHREAIDAFRKAKQLDPYYQDTFGYGLGMAYFFMMWFGGAIDYFERAYKSNPEDTKTLWFLSAAYAHSGRENEAKATFAKLREIWPQYSYWDLKLIFNSKDPADLNLLADGLRKAGME